MATYSAQEILAACPATWVVPASDRLEAFARGVEAAVQWINNQNVESPVAAPEAEKPKTARKAKNVKAVAPVQPAASSRRGRP